MKLLLCIVGLSLLIGIEILRVYFIMPFPGSQEAETLQVAYFLNQFINYFRFFGIALMGVPVYFAFKDGTQTSKIVVAVIIAFYGVVFYSSNFRFLADKIFVQPKNISFAKCRT